MSRLAEMQARFQQKQMQEKEEKLLRLYENQQQRAFEKVGRGSAGSGDSTAAKAGKVRQMFDERRQKAGIDRSYPLEPLRQVRTNGVPAGSRVSNLDRSQTISKPPQTKTTVRSVVQRTVSHARSDKPIATRSFKQSLNATYANGQLLEENRSFEERNGNHGFARTQVRDLEAMMNNHNISDSLEDEDFPDMGVGYGDRENGNVRRVLGDFNDGRAGGMETHKKQVTPAKPPSITKDRTPPKRTITKTQSSPIKTPPTIYSRPSSSSIADKKMKSSTQRSQVSQLTKSQRSQRTSGSSTNDELKECKHCGRHFASDRLETHQEICARTAKKKRKPYDPVKHRVEGTEAENYVKKGKSIKKSVHMGPPKVNWRLQHEEFINSIRAAKMAQAHLAAGGKLSDLPPPPPSVNPDYVQCPHCNRRFNQGAAERHIPKCASMQHNKPKNVGVRKK